jgi:hypothetical protein
MESNLQLLRNFAASSRRSGFGPPGFKLDGTTGEYHLIMNKTGEKMNGKRLAATPVDVMVGWQRIEKGKPPLYVLGRIADGYEPPTRAQLGDVEEPLWPTDKDPWTSATWLPFWNPETREVLVFHAANDGSKEAVASLTQAYVVNCETHPEQINFDPLIELGADSYESKHGRRIYFPTLDIVEWIERPAAVRRIVPPPVKQLELTANPVEADPVEADPVPATTAPAKVKPKAKPKAGGAEIRPPKATSSLHGDMDDEIPF